MYNTPDRGRGHALEADFCVDALKEALGQGQPEVFNTDQGSQFTSLEFTQVLQEHAVKISMDGKGRYNDNIFVERLWRTVKYEVSRAGTYQATRAAQKCATRVNWSTQRPCLLGNLAAVPVQQGSVQGRVGPVLHSPYRGPAHTEL